MNLEGIKETWFVDFEYQSTEGERPIVNCMVAHELRTGRTLRCFSKELAGHRVPPFNCGGNSLVVAYFASAEMGCFLSLGWPFPVHLLDLYVEYRRMRNGTLGPGESPSLVAALAWLGLQRFIPAQKDEMRELSLRGGFYTVEEQEQLLDYCQADVMALKPFLKKLLPDISEKSALLDGNYIKAVALMEHTGVPLDTNLYGLLKRHWKTMKLKLVKQVDKETDFYDGFSFRRERFSQWLTQRNISWPLLPTGTLQLDKEAWKRMTKLYPQLTQHAQLRETLSALKELKLPMGSDGRNRCLLSPFKSKTGRNQPSTTRFIFGLPAWLRSLIKPPEGYAVAYLDYRQQEFAIAAALSGDKNMIRAYRSGDPYLEFARMAGAVPPGATPETHPQERKLYKLCALAVQYEMGPAALASSLGKSTAHARKLLQDYRKAFAEFVRFKEDYALSVNVTGTASTRTGWRMQVNPLTKGTTVRNFPIQAAGAEMLRLACYELTRQGITLCCPIHDAILIMARVEDIENEVAKAQDTMEAASRVITGGLTITIDQHIVCYPDRYMNEDRGRGVFECVMEILAELEETAPQQLETALATALPFTNRSI